MMHGSWSVERGEARTISPMYVGCVAATKEGLEQFKVNVIATTHSPSTLACAPEESIYATSAERAGLQKMTKGRALNLLTAGVPTLAVSFSGRRQVFVESEIDSSIYEGV
jgi:hypothetical protein